MNAFLKVTLSDIFFLNSEFGRHLQLNSIETINAVVYDAQGKYSFDNSVVDGYTTITSLKLNTWSNGEVNYYPNNLANFPVPSSPTVYNFNTSSTAKAALAAATSSVDWKIFSTTYPLNAPNSSPSANQLAKP